MPSHPHDDLQSRFLLPHAGVRGVSVRLQQTWQDILAHAQYPGTVRELLGQSCAAAALFTGHAKVDGRLSVQLRSRKVFCSALSVRFTDPALANGP